MSGVRPLGQKQTMASKQTEELNKLYLGMGGGAKGEPGDAAR
jgi:hypothetical protein